MHPSYSPRVDCDKVGQGEPSFQTHSSVRIVQSFEECSLKLREEWLEHGAGLGEEGGEGVQHRGLHIVGEPVAEDADERPRDVHHRGLESLHAGQLDDLPEAVSRSLLQLWGTVEDRLSEDRKQRGDALGQAEPRQQVLVRPEVRRGEPDGLPDVGHGGHLLARVQALGDGGERAVRLRQHALVTVREEQDERSEQLGHVLTDIHLEFGFLISCGDFIIEVNLTLV